MSKYIAEIDARVDGIPCILGVLYYERSRGSWDEPPSVDLEWVVLDRKGYPAAWLERKLDQQAKWKLDELVMNRLND